MNNARYYGGVHLPITAERRQGTKLVSADFHERRSEA